MNLNDARITVKNHNDLNICELSVLYCVFNPMYKSNKAQYNWIQKQCRKHADKFIGKHIPCSFEFSTTKHYTYLTIHYLNQVIKLSCKNEYFINQNAINPIAYPH